MAFFLSVADFFAYRNNSASIAFSLNLKKFEILRKLEFTFSAEVLAGIFLFGLAEGAAGAVLVVVAVVAVAFTTVDFVALGCCLGRGFFLRDG